MTRVHIHLPRPYPNEILGTNQPTLIVLHAAAEHIVDGEGGSESTIDFFRRYGYSAHSIIEPVGTNIRCRQDNEYAYHAREFNVNSLGIEFQVPGEHDYASFLEAMKTAYLSPAAYDAGLYQVREWLDLHRITRIATHAELSPGRKVDPGSGFPLQDFLHDLGAM